MGRPTKFSDEVAAGICEAIRGGSSVREAAELVGVSEKIVYDWLRRHPDFRDDYVAAQEDRGCYYARRVAEIGEAAERGEIAPAAARVAIDAFKWTAARMAPAVYGDRVRVDGQIDHVARQHDDQLDASYAALLDRIAEKAAARGISTGDEDADKDEH